MKPIVALAPGAGEAIESLLSEKGLNNPLRIDLESSGCCDPVLCLKVDNIGEDDLIQEIGGLTFIVHPAAHQLVGEVTISYVDDAVRNGFVLTSSKPISEWSGFGVCTIKF
jgi:Fe-S cluster assembly iron-binding protein IscA